MPEIETVHVSKPTAPPVAGSDARVETLAEAPVEPRDDSTGFPRNLTIRRSVSPPTTFRILSTRPVDGTQTRSDRYSRSLGHAEEALELLMANVEKVLSVYEEHSDAALWLCLVGSNFGGHSVHDSRT